MTMGGAGLLDTCKCRTSQLAALRLFAAGNSRVRLANSFWLLVCPTELAGVVPVNDKGARTFGFVGP